MKWERFNLDGLKPLVELKKRTAMGPYKVHDVVLASR